MKTKLKNFFLNLQFIFKPWYWIMNEHYSKDMDIHMNELMDKYSSKNIVFTNFLFIVLITNGLTTKPSIS